jgi:hypothetical protein
MYTDKQMTLSASQALTATAASSHIYDQGVSQRPGTGRQMSVMITVPTALDSAGEAATLTIALQSDDDVAFGSATTLYSTSAIAEATLAAGYQIFLPIPLNVSERYLRVYYTVGTEDFTGGTISAHVVEGFQANVQYADAI